jgi:hypothetical protein
VKGVDCVGRDAARELAYTVGLRGAAVPGIFRAAAPSLNEEDKQVLLVVLLYYFGTAMIQSLACSAVHHCSLLKVVTCTREPYGICSLSVV